MWTYPWAACSPEARQLTDLCQGKEMVTNLRNVTLRRQCGSEERREENRHKQSYVFRIL